MSDKPNSVPSKGITEGLHKAQIIYMKRLEKENLERVMKLKRMKKRNILTGITLAASVYGVYLITVSIMERMNPSISEMASEDTVK